MIRRLLIVVGLSGLAISCASGEETIEGPGLGPSHVGATAGGERPAPIVTEGAVSRADLVAVLDRGIPRFLQTVEVAPVMESERFVGFQLVRVADPESALNEVDIQPGDVLRRVNGLVIERPEHAFRVWNELRVASELRVQYLRGGEEREIRFTIVD